MAKKKTADERPNNLSVENEMVRVPREEGEPPRPATRPPAPRPKE